MNENGAEAGWKAFERSLENRLERVMAEGAPLEETVCPVCGSGESHPHVRKWGMAYRRCEKCMSFFLCPRLPEDALLHNFYNDDIAERHRELLLSQIEAAQAPLNGSRMEAISDLTGGRRGALLDVGCACGGFLLRAREQGWNVHGQEICGAFVMEAEKRGLRICARLEDAPWNDIDCVTAWSVLEHVYDPRGFLGELSGKMKPGSILGLWVPSAFSLSAHLLGADWPLFTPPEHVVIFSPQAIRDLLASCGFRVLRFGTSCVWSYMREFLSGKSEDPGPPGGPGPAFWRRTVEKLGAGDMMEIFSVRE